MKLLQEFKLGDLTLKNKVIMAPMTRNRSTKSRVPSELNIEYYKQRSSAGLIITESTAVSANGVGYINAPGIYNSEQIEGWKKLNKAVHENGGHIFTQLFHVGRISHPDFLTGNLPVAPSAIAPKGQIYTYDGLKDYVAPQEMSINEINQIILDFKQAARNAMAAGFDGIEIHAAIGYLINQFIDDTSNKRMDEYGGSVENRSRLLFEVLEVIQEIWDGARVGVRLSPSGIFNSVGDSNSKETYKYSIEKLDNNKLN